MRDNVNEGNPLHHYFATTIQDVFEERLGIYDKDVEQYLSSMLCTFLSVESVYRVKNRFGDPVTSVAEMLKEGDIRFNADSFDRERQVHRHIGDFLLFWSGLFPEHLKARHSAFQSDALLDPVGQGKTSYHIASTFEHNPYQEESRTLKKLSARFETYQYGLNLVRANFATFGDRGWADGFSA